MKMNKKESDYNSQLHNNDNKMKIITLVKDDGTEVYINMHKIKRLEIISDIRLRMLGNKFMADITLISEYENHLSELVEIYKNMIGVTYADAVIEITDKRQQDMLYLSSICAVLKKGKLTIYSDECDTVYSTGDDTELMAQNILNYCNELHKVKIFSVITRTV